MASTTSSRLINAVARITRAALSKELAAHVNEELGRQIVARANQTISFIVDEYSGVAGFTKVAPKPMPGPNSAALELAMSLVATANLGVRSDNLRNELSKIAGQITEKAYENAGLRPE